MKNQVSQIDGKPKGKMKPKTRAAFNFLQKNGQAPLHKLYKRFGYGPIDSLWSRGLIEKAPGPGYNFQLASGSEGK